MSNEQRQIARVFDLISAGPIEGLVGGLSGVYLNGTSVADREQVIAEQKLNISGIADINGTAVTGAEVYNSNTGLFANINKQDYSSSSSRGYGERYLTVAHAAGNGIITEEIPAGATEITADAGTFVTNMETPQDGFQHLIPKRFRIPEGEPDGTEFVSTIIDVSLDGSKATLSGPLRKAIPAGAVFTVDDVFLISSFSTSVGVNKTCTLSINELQNSSLNLSRVPVIVSQPLYGVNYTENNGEGDIVYTHVKNKFKVGTREQAPVSYAGGQSEAVGAAFTISPNFELKRHASAGGTQSTYYITPDMFNLGQSTRDEIDSIDIDIDFPAGLYVVGVPGGRDRNAYAEFQVVLEYKTNSTDPWTKVLVHGADYGGNDFIANVPTWSHPAGSKWYKRIDNYYSGGNTTNAGLRSEASYIKRKSDKSPFIKTYSVTLAQPYAEWRVGIRRMSPETANGFAGNNKDGDVACNFLGKSVVKFAEAKIRNNFRYPLSAYSLTEFSSDDFPAPPERSFHIKGKLVKVPSNYVTRDETGSNLAKYTRNSEGTLTTNYVPWNGKFRSQKVYTNNPAWILYDILTDKDIGLGKFIKEEDIDVYSLYKISRYCDELVPDGKGGSEPRFTCNVYFAGQTEAYKVLKDLASVFKGMMYWIDGEITFIQDTPKEAVYTFTNGNVEDGKFEYSYTGDRARVNQVNVSWNNPLESYKQTILTVEDSKNIVKQERIISKDITAFGCTSEGQAKRAGTWTLQTDTQETEIVQFTTGINAAYLRPGDFVNIQDHHADGLEFSGRVSSGSTTTSIKLDRQITLSNFTTNESHILYLVYPVTGVYLEQDERVTINSVEYGRGDLILADKNGDPITTTEAAANLVDDSGAAVVAQFSEHTRVEKHLIKAVSGSPKSTLTFENDRAFSSAPSQDIIWAVGPSDEYNSDDIKQYRILGIEEQDQKYTVTASLVAIDKYNIIDRSKKTYFNSYSSSSNPDSRIPSVSDIFVELVSAGSPSLSETSTTHNAIISWKPPVETVTDSSGNSSERSYRFLNGYEVRHNVGEEQVAQTQRVDFVPATSNSITIPNASAGTYNISVRVVSDTGAKSGWRSISNAQIKAPLASATRINNISRGGQFTSSIYFDSVDNKIKVAEDDYTYISPGGEELNITSATTAQKEINFSSLPSNSTAYLYYDNDAAEETPSNPWKAVQVHVDNVVEDTSGDSLDFQYFKELGATNNGLTAVSGTVTVSADSTLVTGTGTSFNTHFEAGDLIKLSTSSAAGTQVATSEYRVVRLVESDTKLRTTSAFTRGFTSKYAFKQTLKPDFSEDAILARVQKLTTAYATEFFLNQKAKREAGEWYIGVGTSVDDLPTDSSEAQIKWDTAWAGRPGAPVTGDVANFYSGTTAVRTGVVQFVYGGTSWSANTQIIDGGLFVDGTITAEKIGADEITGNEISSATTIVAGEETNVAALDGTGTGGSTVRIFAGSAVGDKTTAPFRVTQDGALTATNASITGSITASSLTLSDGATVGNLNASSIEGVTQASFTSIGATSYSPAINGSRVTWTIPENDSGNNWAHKLVSDYGFEGGAFVSFKINQDNATNSRYMVGLADATTGNSYSDIDYAIFVNQNTNILEYQGSSNEGELKSSVDDGDVCTIVYDGSFVNYYINQSKVRSVELETAFSGPIYAHIAIDNGSSEQVEHRIDNLEFGAHASVKQQVEDSVTIGSGGLTFVDGGSIKGGLTGFNVNSDDANASGFFLGYDTDAYKFSIGDEAEVTDGQRLLWDGTDLTISGTVNASGGSFTGDVSTASKFTAGSGDNVAVMDGGDTTYRFYAGDATAANAPFQVTKAGALTATNATITGQLLAGSVISGQPTEEIVENIIPSPAQALLSERVVMEDEAIEFAVLENGTRIFKNNELLRPTTNDGTFLSSGTKGQIQATEIAPGDILTSNKPVFFRNIGRSAPSLAQVGTQFVTKTSRGTTHDFYIYSPYGTGTVKVIVSSTSNNGGSATDFSFTSTNSSSGQYVITATEGSVENLQITQSSEATRYYWIESDVPVVITYRNTGQDERIVRPATRELLDYDGGATVRWDPTSTETINEATNSDSTAWRYFSSEILFGSADEGDNSGSDGTTGIPWNHCGDTYIIDHTIRNYQIASLEPSIINVYYWNTTTSEWTFYKRHDFSNASRTNFQQHAEGSDDYQGGSGLVGTTATPWRFVGTGRFALRTNDTSSNEYFAQGYLSSVRLEESLTVGNILADQIQVEDLAAINADIGNITAGTLKGGGTDAPPDADDKPSGQESGSFFDLTNGKFVVGDATNNLFFNGSDLELTGKITTTSGTIGGININSSGIYAGDHNQINSSAQGFFLASTGSISAGNGTDTTFLLNQLGNLTLKGEVTATKFTIADSAPVINLTDYIPEIPGKFNYVSTKSNPEHTLVRTKKDLSFSANQEGGSWNNAYYIQSGNFAGGNAIAFRVNSTTSRYMVGFEEATSSSDLNNSYTNLDYAVFLRGTNSDGSTLTPSYRLYENGQNVQTLSSTTYPPTAGDTWKLQWRNGVFLYILNGEVIREVTPGSGAYTAKARQTKTMFAKIALDGIDAQHSTKLDEFIQYGLYTTDSIPETIENTVEISDGGITLAEGGAIKTSGKDSETDTTDGFFLGYNSNAAVKGSVADFDTITGGSATSGRTAGTYTITATGGSGTGASFSVVIASDGSATISVESGGSGYFDNETLTLPASGNYGGSTDITVDVNGVGNYTFGIGNDTKKLVWDGDDLSITGDLNATSGAFTGEVTTSNKFIAGSNNDVAVMDGNNSTYRFYAGAAAPSDAAFSVDKDGKIVAQDITIYDENGQIILDVEGLHGIAKAGISAASGAGVDEVSGRLDNNVDEITFTTTSSSEQYNFSPKVQIDINQDGESGETPSTSNLFFTESSTSNLTTLIGQVKLIVEYFVRTADGSYSGTPTDTEEFTFVSGTNPTSSQIGLNTGATINSQPSGIIYADIGATEAIPDATISGARLYVKSSKTLTFATADTYKIKINARIAKTDGTTLTSSTTPKLIEPVFNGNYGVALGTGSDQSSLEDFRRLYTITPASGNTNSLIAEAADDSFRTTGGTSLLTTGGTISGDLTVTGNLTVSGTSTTVNTNDLTVADKEITLNYHADNDTSSTANGAGITIQDAVDEDTDASILWNTSTTQFDFSHGITVAGGQLIRDSAQSTNYLKLDDDTSSYGSNGVTLSSVSAMNFILDTNNNDTGSFTFFAHSSTPDNATKIASITETGIIDTPAVVSTGGTHNFGQETPTNVGFVMEEGDALYARVDGAYARNLIKHEGGSTNNITIGQSPTALIGDIALIPGSDGNILFQTNNDGGNPALPVTKASITSSGQVRANSLLVENPATIGHIALGSISNDQQNEYVRGALLITRNEGQITYSSSNDEWTHAGGSSTDWSMISHTADAGLKFYSGPAVASATTYTNTNFDNAYRHMQILSDGTTKFFRNIQHTTTNVTNAFNLTSTNNTADSDHTAMIIDLNISGTDTVTTGSDRTKRGLYIDVDSSASGGGTADETRLYGIWSDVRNNNAGTSDDVNGAYLYGRTSHTNAGQVSYVRGSYDVAYANPTTGTVSNMYGTHGYASVAASGDADVNNVFGVYGQGLAMATTSTALSQVVGVSALAQLHGNNTSDLPTLMGVRSEVQFDNHATNVRDVTNAFAYYALFDNNIASENESNLTLDNSYLFYGNYSGTRSATNAYGVYINSDVVNYFEGPIQIGNAPSINSTTHLTIDADSSGEFIGFSDGGTSKGLIGIANGHVYMGFGGAGLEFDSTNSVVKPILAYFANASDGSSGVSDNATDLGTNSSRFKDGYFAGRIQAGTGSISGPSYKLGSANLGMYSPAAGEIAFTNGTYDLLDLTAGAVIIGTSLLAGKGISQSSTGTVLKKIIPEVAIEDHGDLDYRHYNVLGGSDKKYTVTVTNGGSSQTVPANIFRGDSSHSQYNVSTASTEVVILIEDIPSTQYTTFVGINFGNTSFRARGVKIETFRNNAWQTECDLTNQASNTIARQVASNDSNGVTKVKYTLKDPALTSSMYFRVQNVFLLNYATSRLNYGYELSRYDDQTAYGNLTFSGTTTATADLTIGTGTDSTAIVFPDKDVDDNPDVPADKRQLIKMGDNGQGGLWQTSGRGGLMVASGDDSLVLASGDVGRGFDPDGGGHHPNPDTEEIYLLADSNIRFTTGLQNGFSGASAAPRTSIITDSSDFGLDTTAPKNYINTGSYFKPDSDGKFFTMSNSGNTDGSFILLQSGTTTDNDQYGGLYFTATAGQSDAHRQVAGFDAIVDVHSTNTALNGADLRFFTKPVGAGTAVPRMTIRSTGNVGIGTDAPDQKLHVKDGRAKVENVGNASGTYAAEFVGTPTYTVPVSGGVYNHNQVSNGVLIKAGGTNVNNTDSFPLRVQTFAGDDILVVEGRNQRVGIGTNAPGYDLDVSGTINSSSLYRIANRAAINWDNTNTNLIVGPSIAGDTMSFRIGSNSSVMVIDSSSNIGIGTDDPSSKLHISSGAGTNGDAELIIESDTDNAVESSNALLTLYQDNRLVEGGLRLTGANDDGASGAIDNSFLIRARQSGTSVGHIQFATGGAAAGEANPADPTVRMTIRQQGDIGIGTSSPANKLHVRSGDSLDGIRIENANANAFGGVLDFVKTSASPADGDGLGHIYFRGYNDADPSALHHFASISGFATNTADGSEAGELLFQTATAGGTPVTRLRIDETGNVGIGEDNPGAPLHIKHTLAGLDTLRLESTHSGTGQAQTFGPALALVRTQTSETDGDRLGALRFFGQNDSDLSYEYARIETTSDDVTDGTEDGGLNFYVSSAGSLVEKGSFNPYGLFINTTSSLDNNAQLHIKGNSGGYARITMQDADSTNNPGKTFFSQSDGTTRITTQNGSAGGAFKISTFDGTDTLDRVTVNADGDVGINVAAASSAKLRVGGTIATTLGNIISFGNLEAGNGYVKASSASAGNGYWLGSTQIIDGFGKILSLDAKTHSALEKPVYDGSTSDAGSYIYSADHNYVSNIPDHDNWHDVFSFRRFYTWTYETSTDGSSFSSATISDVPFDQKDSTAYELLNDTVKAARWTINGVNYSDIKYLGVGVNYSPSTPAVNIKVETSSDGSTWSNLGGSTVSGNEGNNGVASSAISYLLRLGANGLSGNTPYIRITITKQTISNTNDWDLAYLRAWSNRPGDQGKGKEYMLPYDYHQREYIRLTDNQELKLGASDDLRIYHYQPSGAGTAGNYITAETGSLYVRTGANDNDVIIQSDNGSGGLADYFRADGSTGNARLYHYGTEKFTTTAKGVQVSGISSVYTDGTHSFAEFIANVDHRALLKVKNSNTNATASASRAGIDLDAGNFEDSTRLHAILDVRSRTSAGNGGDANLTVPYDFSIYTNNKGDLTLNDGDQASSAVPGGNQAFHIDASQNASFNKKLGVGLASANVTNQFEVQTIGNATGTYAAEFTGTPTYQVPVSGGNYIHNQVSNGVLIKAGGTNVNNADSYPLRVQTFAETDILVVEGRNQRVGIGTNSPDDKLHINGGDLGLYGSVSGGVITHRTLHFHASDGAAGLSNSNKNTIGEIAFSGHDSSTNADGKYAHIKSYVIDANNNIQGTEGEGGQLEFSILRHDVSTQARVEYTALTIDNNASITFNEAFTFPTADGQANQVLTTDGSGNVTWADAGGGAIDSITNFANNRVITATDADSLNGEENLTFNGSVLGVPTVALTSTSLPWVYTDNDNYLNFDDDTQLITGGTNATVLSSVSDVAIRTNANDGGGGLFTVATGSSGGTTSATMMMQVTTSGDATFAGSVSAVTKSFDIEHPTKPGMRLHHGSLEGPEHGVYVRGHATENVIELPEYWTGLVDEKTITVQLTANGRFQKLYVEKVENNKVYLRNASWFSNKIDCYYMINATRKDIEEFEVEYGNS